MPHSRTISYATVARRPVCRGGRPTSRSNCCVSRSEFGNEERCAGRAVLVPIRWPPPRASAPARPEAGRSEAARLEAAEAPRGGREVLGRQGRRERGARLRSRVPSSSSSIRAASSDTSASSVSICCSDALGEGGIDLRGARGPEGRPAGLVEYGRLRRAVAPRAAGRAAQVLPRGALQGVEWVSVICFLQYPSVVVVVVGAC